MTPRVSWSVALLLSSLTTLPAPAAEEAAYRPRPKGSLTFTRDVAPLVFKHCAACHRPGEVAPFALLSYRDVKKRARQIEQVTASRFMPPWKPVAGHGEFRSARRLTNDEIGLFKQWVAEGAVEGDAKDLPAPPTFATGWQLGEPDLIVTMPKEYQIPTEGRDVYRNFVIPLQIPEGKYIRAVEYRPSNRRVVHHAGLAFDTSGKLRALDGKDGAPGFTQSSVPGQLFPGSMSFWVPGKEPRPMPEGVSLPWPKGADFVLQLHLHPSGKPEVEQSTVGFYFTTTPPRHGMGTILLNYTRIDIPAGEKAYHTRETKTLDRDVDLYGVFPHMHLIGKEIKLTAVLPDGTTKSLLWIDNWDFNWQNYYEYATPVLLPKGTQMVMEATHDNSADNPANPNQPPKRVTHGEQTTNEMALVFINTLPRHSSASGTPKPAEAKAEERDFLKEAKELLRRYDKDKDGKLSQEEIEAIPAAAGHDVKRLIKRFDKDGDGKLDAEEIAEVLKTLRKS
jgi:hypothetical protein